MMTYNKFKDIGAFARNITDIVWRYIRHIADYPTNARLAVQPDLQEVVIDDPKNVQGCDIYHINNFITHGQDGNHEPNEDAIRQFAEKYYRSVG